MEGRGPVCRCGREGVMWAVCRYGRDVAMWAVACVQVWKGGDVGERKRLCLMWEGRIVFCEEE